MIFCNSASWGPTIRELALRGHRALAVDLPGHGFGATIASGWLGGRDPEALAAQPSGMAGIGTADDVAAVVAVLRRAREHGPVVLVGTSRGGLTLTAVGGAAPELVDRLVYVSAWCCVDATVAEYSAGPENAQSLLSGTGLAPLADPAAVGALRLDWGTGDAAVLDRLQAAILADGTRASCSPSCTTWTRTSRSWSTRPRPAPTPAPGAASPAPTCGSPETGRYRSPCRTGSSPRPTPSPRANLFDVHTLDESHVRFHLHPDGLVDVLEGTAGR